MKLCKVTVQIERNGYRQQHSEKFDVKNSTPMYRWLLAWYDMTLEQYNKKYHLEGVKPLGSENITRRDADMQAVNLLNVLRSNEDITVSVVILP